MSAARWEDVLRVALLGTERAALPPDAATHAREGLDALMDAVMRSRSPEHALLAAAGLLWQARRAGRTVRRRAQDEAPRVAPAETRPVQGLRAASALMQIANTAPQMLGSWLRVLALRGIVAHPTALCALLEQGTEEPALRARIAAVLGERGVWLAAQNPAWDWVAAFVIDDADPERIWRLGRMEEREALLQRLRVSDPSRALALLQTTWSRDGGAARAAFVAALAEGLSMQDEAFLEEALDDRRPAVRAEAAGLLARLADARLVQRMMARLDPLLDVGVDVGARLPARLRERETLLVSLPNACDEAMARDGVRAGVPVHHRGTGERAWWLLQMLAAVPPSHHVRRLGRSARALVDAAAGSEHARVLLEGFRDAAVNHRDTDMAAALVDAFCEAPQGAAGGAYAPPDVTLLLLLPAERRAHLAREMLRPPLDDRHPALCFVEACSFAWDAELGQAFVRAIRASMRVPIAESEAVRRLLGKAALCVPSSCVSFAQMGWPLTERPPAWTWVSAYNAFLASLRVREEALATLDDVQAPPDPPSARNQTRSAVFESDAGTDSASMP